MKRSIYKIDISSEFLCFYGIASSSFYLNNQVYNIRVRSTCSMVLFIFHALYFLFSTGFLSSQRRHSCQKSNLSTKGVMGNVKSKNFGVLVYEWDLSGSETDILFSMSGVFSLNYWSNLLLLVIFISFQTFKSVFSNPVNILKLWKGMWIWIKQKTSRN